MSLGFLSNVDITNPLFKSRIDLQRTKRHETFVNICLAISFGTPPWSTTGARRSLRCIDKRRGATPDFRLLKMLAAPILVAYFAAWSIYTRSYFISDIPGEKITHINYAFANIGSDGRLVLGDAWADVEKAFPGDTWDQPLRGNFNQLIKLREKYPHLKTLISVGGWVRRAASCGRCSPTFSLDLVGQILRRRRFAGQSHDIRSIVRAVRAAVLLRRSGSRLVNSDGEKEELFREREREFDLLGNIQSRVV